MKVFNKEKFIERYGIERYESCKEWVDRCDGLTEEQIEDLGFLLDYDAMVEKEEPKAKNNKLELDFKVNVDDEGLEDTVDMLKEVTDLIPNITIRNNENVYVTVNNFNSTAKEYYKEAE